MLGRLEITISAAALAFGLGFYFGHQSGTSAAKGAIIRAQQEQMEAADLASRKEAQRLAAEAARIDLSVQLEDAANAQEPAAACLPVSRVLRLNQR